MKYLLYLLLVCTASSFAWVEDIYSLKIKNIDGQEVSLGQFRGRKMLIVTLPVTEDSTLSLKQLAALQQKYTATLTVIGVPAEEDGFKDDSKGHLKKIYKDQPSSFIIAESMKVKKKSGKDQSTLFQWLTSREKNRHFEQEVLGGGHKFFVDEEGELYAVMGPQITLSNPVIERILSKPVKKD